LDNGKEAKRGTVPFTIEVVLSDLSTPQRVGDSTASILAEFLSELLKDHGTENPPIVARQLLHEIEEQIEATELRAQEQGNASEWTLKEHAEAFGEMGTDLLNVGIRIIAAAALYSMTGQFAQCVSDQPSDADDPALRLVK
jgi:hypothetical protein